LSYIAKDLDIDDIKACHTSHHFNRWRYQNNANSPNPNSH
jgi:hypothetical protein